MISLGCPKNTVDTENVLGDLSAQGYELTTDNEEAEILIINTCGFIEASTKESIDVILEAAELKNSGKCKKLVVTGCLAERYDEALIEEIPEIDHLLGVKQYPQLKNLLELEPDQVSRRNLVHDPAEYFEPGSHRIRTTPFYTAYLKIGEGCSNKCAFCIIPKMRGNFRSFPMESLLNETRQLAEQGVREFNVVSQDTTMYGIDLRMKNGLVTLLKAMVEIPGVDWIRLLYCYPTFIDRALMEYMAEEGKVCNYIDVPLQHSHDFMLKYMKRQEREAGVRDMLCQLRDTIPGVALRTTFIVGFPGETEEHFNHLNRFVEEQEFDHVGVFVYSNEEGTTAYNYPESVPRQVAEERRDILMETQRKITFRRNSAMVGQIHPVLVEGQDADEDYLVTGRLASQAPEIDGQVIIEESDVQPGEIVPMRIQRAAGYDIIAKLHQP